MNNITSYEQLKALVSAQFKPGVLTNAAICERDYVPFIEAGTLLYAEGPFGLLLVREKREHALMTFYLVPPKGGAGEEPSADAMAAFVDSLPLPQRCLLEIAYRDRDVSLKALAEGFKARGFEKQLGRIRYTRPAGLEASVPVPIDGEMTERTAQGADLSPEETEEVRAFIAHNFVERTGCWPSCEELAYDKVIMLRDERGLCGLIHCQTDGPMPNIRHMAVREDCRGKGLTGKLLSRFCSDLDGKAMVWVKEHDEAAMHAYSKFGFAPDGRETVVLFRL